MSTAFLLISVMGASAVEMVEALTIILAVGITRGWKSALEGAGAALIAISAIGLIFGPPLVKWVPINDVRLVVGGFLLIFGLQWLRKAILRASGFKSVHDEDAIYQKNVTALLADSKTKSSRRDTLGFVVSFKGVFLEGIEVIVIVISFGASSQHLGLAVIGAVAAAAIVGTVGLAMARPLSRVPENDIKLGVSVILTTFGTFWVGEGAGLEWPGADMAILGLLATYVAVASGFIYMMKRAKAEVTVKQSVKVIAE